VEKKQFPKGLVDKCYIIPPDSKLQQNAKKLISLMPTEAVLTAVKPSFPTEMTLKQ